MEWQTPETAPKDGSPIIGCFDWPIPIPVVAMWNECEESWIVADYDGDFVCSVRSQWFENILERPEKLKRWIPMPKIPENDQQ